VSVEKKFTIDEVAALVNDKGRNVRYYIQQGLVDHPEGTGKGAFYTQRHVEQLLLVKKWRLAGLSLERIGDLLKQPTVATLPPAPRRPGTVEVWSHLVVADGVEVTLEPSRAGLSPKQARAFFREVSRVFQQVRESEEQE
jgi:DNA-binding transcriptional MerR regulator